MIFDFLDIAGGNAGFFSQFFIGQLPVSYTHLDVYKRQGTGNPFGVVIATVAGVPMYADIFGCIPIAEALLAKGARLGVVLAFMMGVTTLSLPSIIMLKKAVKTKLLGIFVAICTPVSYTHLDVYKRQGVLWRSGRRLSLLRR